MIAKLGTKALRYAMVLLILACYVQVYSQNKASVKGKILDSLSSTPLVYASVSVFTADEKKLINGTMTGEQGDFSVDIPYGTFYAEINFVGFKPATTSVFSVSKNNPVFDFGKLPLTQTIGQLEEVVVQAEKSSMELALDKKIFNVGKDLANSGGTASDVLTNIPSVSVDPEGNIKLRGSENVRILINGKPSGLVSFKGGSGLQQLQASMIERVEVITNPSARYEAEGLGGIINIVLKKDNSQGFNGSLDVIAGQPDNYGLAANLNYRHRKINFFINYGFAYRNQPGRGSLYQEVYGLDTIFFLKQTNESNTRGLNNNIRGGLDFFFTEKSILTASYLFRRSDVNRITDIVYNDFLFSLSNMTSYTKRRQDEEEAEPNSEYSLIYKKVLPGKGHELLAEIKFLDNWESSDQLFTQYQFNPDGTEDPSKALVQKSLNDESEKQYLLQIDYSRPFAKEGKFEAGLRTSFRDMINDYLVSQQNSSGGFDALPGLDNIFFYDENITAAYGIIGNKTHSISYQVGLRAEWTNVKTTLAETNEVNPRKYANLFPSAHVTFDLPKENGIQVSYSRRVRRPFYNDLSPFVTFSDNRNYFSGNPDLNPEFSNVFEIGHIKYMETGSLSSSLYNRNTEDKIDNIRTVDSNGNAVTITENLVSERAYGAEFASTIDITKWWKWDASFNFFYAEIDGSNIVSTYKTNTYSWFTRQLSRFTLPGKFDLQLRSNYEAPQKTAQGRRKSLYYVDFAISKEILKGKATLNLNILDVFNTRKSRNIFEGAIFYSDRNFQQRRRQINVTFNYRIKRSKGKLKRGEESVEGF
jgi:ferric enterobactin receptor